MFQDIIAFVVPTNLNWICVFVASMLPLIEIRGAIPFGLSTTVFGTNVLSLWQVCGLSFCGATISAVFVLFVLKLIFKLANKNKKFEVLRKKIVVWLDLKFFRYKNRQKVHSFKKWFALMLFVGLPIPFSGVWTACLLAVFLNMKFFETFSAIAVGNLLTTIIVSFFCTVFIEFVDLVFVVFVIITIMIVAYYFLKMVFQILNKKRAKNNNFYK